MKNHLSIYKKYFNDNTIKHLVYDYDQNSQGLRHPHGPLGIMFRTQGQTDIYAGKSRIVLGIKGEFLSLATNYHVISEKINFTSRGIENFRILGKSFNKNLFNYQKVLALKSETNLAPYSIIGPGTRVIVNGEIGDIINSIPLTTLFEDVNIFNTDKFEVLTLPPDIETLQLISKELGI